MVGRGFCLLRLHRAYVSFCWVEPLIPRWPAIERRPRWSGGLTSTSRSQLLMAVHRVSLNSVAASDERSKQTCGLNLGTGGHNGGRLQKRYGPIPSRDGKIARLDNYHCGYHGCDRTAFGAVLPDGVISRVHARRSRSDERLSLRGRPAILVKKI